MPDSQGPYVNWALFCEKMLRETDNVVSFIRVIDRITVHEPVQVPEAAGPLAPVALIPVTFAAAVKAGDVTGTVPVRIRVEPPSGPPWPDYESTLDLEGADTGAAVIVPIQLPARIAGIYWFVFEVAERELTRVPLQIIHNPVAPDARAQQD